MAIETGSETAALKARLLQNGHRYSFLQVYRLLRLIARKEGIELKEIKTRPNTSLAFPESDVFSVRERDGGGYQLTVNFLGLYGVSSPLPTFYTENLLDEQQYGFDAPREFLDVVSQTIYPLFFQAWLKSRLHLRLVEFEDNGLLDILYKFVGINNRASYEGQPGFESLLGFAGLYTQFPRSAAGLRRIVAACFPSATVELFEQDLRVRAIPDDQRCLLGMQATYLGEDSHLGAMFTSRSSNLSIVISGIDHELYQQLLPGCYQFRRLQFLVRHYLVEPLNVYVKIVMKDATVAATCLSRQPWASLGRDAWLLAPSPTVGSPLPSAEFEI
jgi:type VI secretion system protein ImpH